jgi:hypothetical protein
MNNSNSDLDISEDTEVNILPILEKISNILNKIYTELQELKEHSTSIKSINIANIKDFYKLKN